MEFEENFYWRVKNIAKNWVLKKPSVELTFSENRIGCSNFYGNTAYPIAPHLHWTGLDCYYRFFYSSLNAWTCSLTLYPIVYFAKSCSPLIFYFCTSRSYFIPSFSSAGFSIQFQGSKFPPFPWSIIFHVYHFMSITYVPFPNFWKLCHFKNSEQKKYQSFVTKLWKTTLYSK